MNYTKWLLSILSLVVFAFTFSACADQKDPDVESGEAVGSRTVSDEDLVEKDNLQVDKNVGAYTYIIDPASVVVPVVEPEQRKEKSKTSRSERATDVPEKVEKPGVEKLDASVDIDSVPPIYLDLEALVDDITLNRPPVYGIDCLSAQYPVKCSSDKVTSFVEENLNYPEAAIDEGHDGLEVVTFQVAKDGKVENIKVKSKEIPCAGCQKAAVRVVAAMPDKWAPALHNGEPVRSTVTLPIRFNTFE